jgi:hypothetical protein
MTRSLIWPFARAVGMHCPVNGLKSTSRFTIKLRYIAANNQMTQANVQFDEGNQDWLEEWLTDNPVKTLTECKRWKEYVVLLEQPVEGIIMVDGFGCPDCKYAHDRKRDVVGHMKKFHCMSEDRKPNVTQVQAVFSSHLHSFFKVSEPGPEPPTPDEGLLASRAFRAEFEEIEAQDVPLSLG